MPETTTRTKGRTFLAVSGPDGRSAPRSQPRSLALPRPAVACALLVAIALVYWPSAVALDGLWRDFVDHTYAHGYLILLTSLFLGWRDRNRLELAPLKSEPLALPALLVLSAAWLYFWKASIQDAHLLLLPVILGTALACTFGWAVTRVLLFPVGFLYFAMPVWSDLVDPLQHLSVAANGALIWATGLPAYIDGNLVKLPAGTLEIAEGCSGMHFLIVGLALAALYGEIVGDTLRHRALWLGLMGALALIANWLRIFVVIVAAYATDMRSPLVAHHYWFGWLVFAGCFSLFLWIAGRIAQSLPPEQSAGPRLPPKSRVTAEFPTLGSFIATLLCFSLLPLAVYAADASRGALRTSVDIDWPAVGGDWNGPLPVMSSDWKPVFQNPTAIALREYVGTGGEHVEVFVVAYRTQRQGAKLVAYANSLLGSGSLQVLNDRAVETAGGAWRALTVKDHDGSESLLWSQYRVGHRHFVSPRASQLWYGIAAFVSEPVSSALAIRTACVPTCEAATNRLREATAKLEPSLRLTSAPQGD